MVASSREPLVPKGWPGTYVPNFSDWRPGDIALAHRTPDAIGRGIQAAQAISFSPVTQAGSAFSHAAIYVGEGMLVDATLAHGVSYQSVWNYCQTRALKVRRISHPNIPMEDIEEVALEAQRHIGKSYSLLQAVVSKLVPGTTPQPNALYCSTFVGLVVANATGLDLSHDPAHQPLHPGTLAAHPFLTDVLVEWRHL